MRFKILQIKDIENTDYAFRSFNTDIFNIEDYEVTYDDEIDEVSSETLSFTEICDYLFVIFNTNRPKDFTGHSLSISDLIQIETNGTIHLYYCNPLGWQRINMCRS